MGILGWLRGGGAFPEFVPRDSEESFREFGEAAGSVIDTLSAPQAVELMLRHYGTLRARGCSLEQDGDMLLFQWGAYDWGDGEHFEFDLTRQFIVEDADGDDGMSQLSLTLQFPPSDALRALSSGNRWCHTPAGLGEFEAFIRGSEAYRVLEHLPPAKVAIGWGGV